MFDIRRTTGRQVRTAGFTAQRTWQTFQGHASVGTVSQKLHIVHSIHRTNKRKKGHLIMHDFYPKFTIYKPSVPKSLGLDESSLPSPLMLLHLLSITLMSSFQEELQQ